METLKPETDAQLRDAIRWALDTETPLELIGGGTKRAIGHPVRATHLLDLSGLSGILAYEPEELVLTARAGTPLAEIEAALADRQQHLAFEPPDYRHLLAPAPPPLAGGGREEGALAASPAPVAGTPHPDPLPQGERERRGPTLGGTIAANLAGPRRLVAGAARDHLLGFAGVNSRGEAFKAGGKVVKNVTGYDLPKLIAGSWGTLAALGEITVKVLPRPETARTLALAGLDPAEAVAAMTLALGSQHEISGAAWLPASLVPGAGASLTLLRLEGPAPSVAFRYEALARLLNDFLSRGAGEGGVGVSPQTLWPAIGDAAVFEPAATIWKISVRPSAGPAILAAFPDGTGFLDWAGGLVWLALPPAPDADAGRIRRAVAAHGGHATLIRADESIRRDVPVFEPLPGPLAALTARVKESFDPKGVLNPGRMYPSG